MAPPRSPVLPERHRTALAGLLAASFTAGTAAAVVSLTPGSARLAPAGLDLTALLTGASALWLARLRRRAREQPRAREHGAGRTERIAGGARAGSAAAAAIGSGIDDVQAELGEQLPDSVRRAFVNLARRIQAAVNRQLRELREMEARHGADAVVFGDLLTVDHATALIGRLADSLAVLGGDRPGRRWHRPIPLIGVLRGAMSRITEYRRVDLAPLPEGMAVDGAAVEALVHALAELLDNATRYSPPESRVVLRAYAVGGGLAIEVEDAGVGLGAEAAARAELMLRTEDFGLELAALGEAPRLGLAVVGRLARAAGFEAALQHAERGGVRALLLVPHALLREPQAQEPSGPRAARPASHRATSQGPAVRPMPLTAHGLPQRRRYVPGAEPPPGPSPSSEPLGGQPATGRSSTGRRGSTGQPPAGQRPTGNPYAGPPSADDADPAGDRTGDPGAEAPPEPAASPRPGLWLAPFHAGLRGEPPAAVASEPGSGRENENGATP